MKKLFFIPFSSISIWRKSLYLLTWFLCLAWTGLAQKPATGNNHDINWASFGTPATGTTTMTARVAGDAIATVTAVAATTFANTNLQWQGGPYQGDVIQCPQVNGNGNQGNATSFDVTFVNGFNTDGVVFVVNDLTGEASGVTTYTLRGLDASGAPVALNTWSVSQAILQPGCSNGSNIVYSSGNTVMEFRPAFGTGACTARSMALAIRISSPNVRTLQFRKVTAAMDAVVVSLGVRGDAGDAPNTYSTLWDNDVASTSGPFHQLPFSASPPNLRMGALALGNGNGIPTTAANGDTPDEDGVTTFPTIPGGSNVTLTNYTVNVNVANGSGATANLCGWMDWNNNGVFDTGERTCTTVSNGATTAQLIWPTAAVGSTTGRTGVYGRFRLTNDALTLPTGRAGNGEVEDYRVSIAAPVPPRATNDASMGNPAGTSVTQNILANDTLSTGVLATPANSTVTLTNTGLPAGSTVSGNTVTVPGQGLWTYDPTTGNLTFAPIAGFLADPTPLTYTLTETATGLTDNATVTVGYVQDAPIAVNDVDTYIAGSPKTVNVLTNDVGGSTPIGSTVVITTAGASADGKSLTVPGEGTWTVNATTGAITFTPAASFTGNPTPIRYTVRDAQGDVSNVATVTLTTGALPVTLIRFMARPANGKVLLTWTTASEINFDRFIVQKFDPSIEQFVSLREIDGGRSFYSFTDEDITREDNYYRLKMIDKDGTFEYSKSVSVEMTVPVKPLRVYPNPVVENRFFLSNEMPIESPRLVDISGRAIVVDIKTYPDRHEIRVPSGLSGIYILIYQIKGVSFKEKLIFQ